MKIFSIQNYNLIDKNNKYKSKSKTQNLNQQNRQFMPSAYYPVFNGGYSLDLASTVLQLDKLAEKNSSIYPKNIREWLGLIIESGNKAKDTLITAHKKYFEELSECDTLAQIKARFPEFKNVKSAFNVETGKGRETLISKFQKGESEYFDNDEDLSVQLIKLYWGQGFSLNDLKRYSDGTDLYYTMTKLEIPTASRDYGHILKMSDPEYNERLTREMTEKRLAALDRKAQELDGEPVYIKRGHHSEEHKQRISEGLQKYYEEHPEKTYEMSERQKKFYLDNPERAEIYSRVLKKAWSIFGADNIKKAMSKFFQKRKIKMFDLTGNPAELTKQQSDAMKMFWGQNEWAKKSFSKNMKFAWKKIKDDKNYYIDVQQIPLVVQKKLKMIAFKNGIDIRDLNFNSRIFVNDVERSYKEQQNNLRTINKLIELYEKEDAKYPDDMANTYYRATLQFTKSIIKNVNPKQASLKELVLLEHSKKIQDILVTKVNGQTIPNRFTTHEIHEIYNKTVELCLNTNQYEYIKNLNDCLNKAYNLVILDLRITDNIFDKTLNQGYKLLSEMAEFLQLIKKGN